MKLNGLIILTGIKYVLATRKEHIFKPYYIIHFGKMLFTLVFDNIFYKRKGSTKEIITRPLPYRFLYPGHMTIVREEGKPSCYK